MPDISMCRNRECVMRETCFRYRAVPSEYQSYGRFLPDGEDGYCDDFIPVRGGRVRPMSEIEYDTAK